MAAQSMIDLMGSSIKTVDAIKDSVNRIADSLSAITQAMSIQLEEQQKTNEANEKRTKAWFVNLFKDKKPKLGLQADPLKIISANVQKIADTISTKPTEKPSSKTSKTKTPELETLKDLSSVLNTYKKIGGSDKKITKGVEVAKNFLTSILKIFSDKEFKKLNTAKMTETVAVIKSLGGSILEFSASLAKTLLLAAPAWLGWIAIRGLIASALETFNVMCSKKNMKKIQQGGLALSTMSAGLLAFTASLALSTLIVAGMGMGLGVGKMGLAALGALGVFALAFGTFYLFSEVLGKTKNVKNALIGSLALTIMSAGLLTFALAMKSTSFLTPTDFLTGGALLVIGALAITIIGAIGLISGGALYGFALLGAVTLAAMSVSLILFASSIKAVSLMSIDSESLTGFKTSAELLVSTFVTLSVGALLALPAAISMLTIALSTILVCTALTVLSNMKIFNDGGAKLKDKIANFSVALNNLKGAFLGEEPKEEGFWGKLGGAVTGLVGGTVDMIRAIEASVMFLTLSTSAIGIAKALEKLSEFDTNKISIGAKGLNLVLSELSKTFSEDDNKELFKTLGKAIIGVKSFEMLGAGISNMATGIALFAELEANGIPQYDSNGKQTGRFTKVNYAKITDSIVNIAKSLADAFSNPIFTEVTTISCDGFWGTMGAKKVVPKFAAALESFGSLGVVMDGLSKMVNTFGGDIDSKKVKAGIKTTFGTIKEIFGEENSSWMKGLNKKFKQWENFKYITEPISSLNGIDLTKAGLDQIPTIGKTINDTKVENIKAATNLAKQVSNLKNLQTDKLTKMFEKLESAAEKMIEMLDKSNQLTENLSGASTGSNTSQSVAEKIKSSPASDQEKASKLAPIPATHTVQSEPQEIRITLNGVEGESFRVTAEY